MRSEVIRKSPPDYYIGKFLLHGKILREVKVHLSEQCVVAVISAHMPIYAPYLVSGGIFT
jgi:hypothetical protein